MENLKKDVCLQELNIQEMESINGGVPWWMYLAVGPCGAYILNKFEQGFIEGFTK